MAIRQSTPDVLSIYLLTNTINGKYYVGQTRRPVAKRWAIHRCEARKKRATRGYLYNAIRKYGADAFLVETLATAATLDELNRLESLWILVLDALNPSVGYNAAGGGGNRLVTAATRAKNSARFLGRRLTPEHRAKVGRPGVPKSAVHRANIRAALKGRTPSPQARAAVAAANRLRIPSDATRAKLRAAAQKANDKRWAQQRALMRQSPILSPPVITTP